MPARWGLEGWRDQTAHWRLPPMVATSRLAEHAHGPRRSSAMAHRRGVLAEANHRRILEAIEDHAAD